MARPTIAPATALRLCSSLGWQPIGHFRPTTHRVGVQLATNPSAQSGGMPCSWQWTKASPNSPFARRIGHHDWFCTPWQPTQDHPRRTKRKAHLLIPQKAHSLGIYNLDQIASSKCLNGTPPSVNWGNQCSSRPCLQDRPLFHPILSTKPESHPNSPRLFPSALSHCAGPSSPPCPSGAATNQPHKQQISRKMVPIQQWYSNLAVPFLASFCHPGPIRAQTKLLRRRTGTTARANQRAPPTRLGRLGPAFCDMAAPDSAPPLFKKGRNSQATAHSRSVGRGEPIPLSPPACRINLNALFCGIIEPVNGFSHHHARSTHRSPAFATRTSSHSD